MKTTAQTQGTMNARRYTEQTDATRGTEMNTLLPTDDSRSAQRDAHHLQDLGRMPPAIRDIAYNWGGSFPGTIALYQVASTDGLTRNPAELRGEISTITDRQEREALLAWLDQAEAQA